MKIHFKMRVIPACVLLLLVSISQTESEYLDQYEPNPNQLVMNPLPQPSMIFRHYYGETPQRNHLRTTPKFDGMYDPYGSSGYYDNYSPWRIDPNPFNFGRIAPPKAIMTTAADIITAHGTPWVERSVNSPYKQMGRPSLSSSMTSSRRRPPLISHNHFNNKQNHEFSYMNNRLGQPPSFGYKKPGQKTKASENSDEFSGETAEQTNFISKPFVNWGLREANEQPKDDEQPHNILPFPDDSPTQIPTPEMEDFEELYNSIMDIDKVRDYNCPDARNLHELASAELYPDPWKCDQFYYCKWGKAYVFKCPLNNFFNPYLKACDIDEDYACAMSLRKK
ncbi:unnamed protein product [Orchesella dallaii]|uniref:Chitin-binding type-2 domain-containing protein n=1 Tax=Orchesella dallaii TaxID=48710 RepID=A0ABP1QCS6_9HEXA